MNGVGPYVEMDGPKVYVPRTVPYREAWGVARGAVQEPDTVLHYLGKVEAELTGFARDCPCLEGCERRYREDDDLTYVEVDRTCVVPAWMFEQVER